MNMDRLSLDRFRPRQNDRSGIVLDIGMAYTKIGFSGENGPIKIIKTPSELFSEFKNSIPVNLTAPTSQQSPPQPQESEQSSHGTTDYSWEQRVFEGHAFLAQSLDACNTKLRGVLEEFLHSIFFYDLLQKLSNKTIYICENYLFPRSFYELLAALLFNKFEIPKIVFLLNNSLPLYITGLTTGLVVECGYFDTQITPIYEGFPLMNNIVTAKCGGYLINKFIKHYLIAENPNLLEQLTFTNIEDIKFKYCKLLKRNQEQHYESMQEDCIKSQVSITVGKSKVHFSFHAATKSLSNGLFGNVEADQPNLAHAILQCLSSCDPDVAVKISKNILLSGGTSSTQNLEVRLKQELLHQIDNNPAVSQAKYLKNHIAFTSLGYPSSSLLWIGASIVSQLNINEKYSITLDKFRSKGFSIPDVYGNDYLFLFKRQESNSETDSLQKYEEII